MNESVAIGVDIGGTKIAFAVVNQDGMVLLTHRLETAVAEGPEAVFKQVATGIEYLIENTPQPIAGVGIGTPGHLNPHTGHIYNATNLYWRDVNLLEGVKKNLAVDYPVWVQKDANASALGELYFGAARGYQDAVLITIGTGLGGGAIVSGDVVEGAQYSAMEIGHMPLNPNGRMCVCGMRGCPEMYVSGVGIIAGAIEYLPDYPDSALSGIQEITTKSILDGFRSDDALCKHVLEDTTDWLCSVMIACMGILNPALFVIGGGLGLAAYDFLSASVKQKLLHRTRREIHQAVPIVKSTVPHSAIGPACIVWHKLKER